MIRSTLAVTSLSLCLLAGLPVNIAAPARAQPDVIVRTEVNVIVPQSRRPVWTTARPTVEMTAANATIDFAEQTVTTHLEIALSNKDARPQEAQVLLPVPDGAVIRSFQYDGTGPEPTAKLLPRDEASRIYTDIVSRSKDPGLLEFAGMNVIRSSVFPIPANTTQSVRIVYEQVIPTDAGRIDYVLPRTESLAARGVKWTIKGTIKHSRPIATVYSPTHDLATEPAGAQTSFRVADSSASGPGSFRLSVMPRPADGDGPVTSLFAYPDPQLGPDSGYFVLLMSIPRAGTVETLDTKREVTLVIDRSGSMRGEKIEQARAAALGVIQGLKDGEQLSIVDYSDSVATYSASPVTLSPKTRAEAEAYVKGLTAEGGTNIHDALLTALKPSPQAGSLPIMLFLTDGLPTVGETREKAIRDAALKGNAFERRIFTFGVGFDVNSPLLSSLARGSRGAPTFVLPGENVEQKVSQVFRRLSGPILAGPTLTSMGGGAPDPKRVREMLPASIPDVFDGDQTVIVGQYRGTKQLDLLLKGKQGVQDRTFTLSFGLSNASNQNGFVPRLWAQRKIAALLEQIRDAQAEGGAVSDPKADPKTKELVDEIVTLSQRWGIMTEYTSFLATEPGFGMGQEERVRETMLSLQDRGKDRAGAAGVNQAMNTAGMQVAAKPASKQMYLGRNMEQVEITTVQAVGDQTFYRRGQRWVDSRVTAKPEDKPDETVEVGSARFNDLINELRTQNLLGVLALEGEVELQMGAKRILIKAGA